VKRFYRGSSATEIAEGFGVALDGKPLRTPAKQPLLLPTRALAEAIAGEWEAQAEKIRPETMPLTRLAGTAIDRVAIHKDAVAAEALRYAGTDMLCYRTVEPAELAARQAACWQPLLDWAALRFDAPLLVSSGIQPVEQPVDSLRAIGNALAALDVFTLTALADLTYSCGSVVLALAIIEEKIPPGEAFAAALLDELYQAERWGDEQEAAERRRHFAADIEAAARFVALLRG
jgi:chaperone required for assembly of F1-ATPase